MRAFAYDGADWAEITSQCDLQSLIGRFEEDIAASFFNHGPRRALTYNVHIFQHTLEQRMV